LTQRANEEKSFLSHLKEIKKKKKTDTKDTRIQINEIRNHLNHSGSISIVFKALRVGALDIIDNNG